MKHFLKTLLAVIIGLALFSLINSIIILSIFGVIFSSSQQVPKVKSNSILVLAANQQIVDRTSIDPLNTFNSITYKQQSALGLNEVLQSIKKAQTDDRIKGILLTEMTYTNTGLGILEEVRNALIEFRASGKFIISYSDLYGQKPYYLASIADKVYMNPEGNVDLRGIAASVTFFKGTLEKLDIEAQIIRHGKFKSAVEPFMYEKMSTESRAQINTYTSSIWRHITKGIAEARQISEQKINTIADRIALQDSKAAVDLQIIDALKYRDEVLAELAILTEQASSVPSFIPIRDYSKTMEVENSGIQDKVAVVYAIGNIVNEGDSKSIGTELVRDLRKARLDSFVKAIVIRINSPGGSALTSEIIHREVQLAATTKPVVVSMGDVAASGGYYIACPASYIMASPTSLTGSIGVFGVVFNAKMFLKNKVGITVDVANTNQHADMGNMARPLSEPERKYLQHQIEKIYSCFTQHVSNGRKMTIEQVYTIAEGRVWSGVDAKKLNLIDDFGGLNDAIEKAVLLANLNKYQIIELPKLKTTIEVILESFEQVAAKVSSKPTGNILKDYAPLAELLSMHGNAQTRIPYNIEIK
ncbi:MAG: signal peptide peptidase SppA [Bacteroidales bacterium]